MKRPAAYKHTGSLLIMVFLSTVLLTLGVCRSAAAAKYEINGFYLGATPDDIGVVVDVDPERNEKHFEVEAQGVLLFFIQPEDSGELRLYRIVKEQGIRPDNIISVLSGLKSRYGTPDKQEIKTASMRPKKKTYYITTAKNRAVWNVSETQEYIVEIEKNRVVYELLDHNPENIRAPQLSQESQEDFTGDGGWNPDY